jgi:hypothetical protein
MKLAMKMQGGELVVYSKPGKTLTGIQKQQIEQREAAKFWKEWRRNEVQTLRQAN